jgi:hypothetical protein
MQFQFFGFLTAKLNYLSLQENVSITLESNPVVAKNRMNPSQHRGLTPELTT